MKVIDYIALILIIVGAVVWGLIGFFNYDLIGAMFGGMSAVTRILYALVGIAGLYAISYFGRLKTSSVQNY